MSDDTITHEPTAEEPVAVAAEPTEEPTAEETIEAEIAKGESEKDTRSIKGFPAAEKLLEIVAAAKPPAREWSPSDHDEYLSVYSPIAQEWMNYALENEMTQREIDFAIGMFMAYSDFVCDMIKNSFDTNRAMIERKLISKALNLPNVILDKKDLTLKQWSDILK